MLSLVDLDVMQLSLCYFPSLCPLASDRMDLGLLRRILSLSTYQPDNSLLCINDSPFPLF
jgi:hypothetical protein